MLQFLLFLLICVVGLIVFAVVKGVAAHARNKEQENDIHDIMWRAEHGVEPGKPAPASPYASSKAKDNQKSSKRMIIGGSILTFIGTAVTIYGNNLNNNIDAAEAFEHFWNTSTISYNPGDPFFIAGLVVLGVGALLLVGGVVWLIIAKNKSE